MNRVVCFDFWNTLARSLEGDGASYSDVFVRLGANRKNIYPIVRDVLMCTSMDYERMVLQLCTELGLQPSSEDLAEAVANWRRDNEYADWFTEATVLLTKLRQAGDTLVLATNITEPAWCTVDRKLSVTKYFDGLYLSCRAEVAKPDRRVWEQIESDWSGQSYWMIGDNQADDLDVPAKMNWQTILVRPDGRDLTTVGNRLLEEMK